MPTTTFYTSLLPSVDKSVHNLYFKNSNTILMPPSFTYGSEQVLDTTSTYFNPYTENLQVGDELIYTANGNYYTNTTQSTGGGNLVFRFYKNGVQTFVHTFNLPHSHNTSALKYNVTIQQIVKENGFVSSNASLILFELNNPFSNETQLLYEERAIDFSTLGDFGTTDTLNVEFRNLVSGVTPYLALRNLKIKILPFK